MEENFKTRQELAQELNISPKTLKRKLQDLNYIFKSKKMLSPGQVLEIKQLLQSKNGLAK